MGRRTPDLFREAFDRAPEAMLLLDAAGHVVRPNRAASRMPALSHPRGGEPFVQLLPRSVRAALERWLDRLAEDRHVHRLEILLPAATGDTVLELSGAVLEGTGEPLRQVLIRDITDRIRLAERALHAERLASIGRLAATLAHEIRNTLAGIDGALQVFQAADDLPPHRRDIVVEMRDRISRTREVVDDLLAYSRPPRLSRHPWLVTDVLHAMKDSIAAHPEAEHLDVRIGPTTEGGDLVAVDVFQIRLVARNLLLNSAQAMGGAGVVRISARREGREVLFRFEDDGPGVDPALRGRVFEPFFTTRPGGTGLGLPIATNVVEAHGGRLYLDAARETRSAFVVALPLHGAMGAENDDNDRER